MHVEKQVNTITTRQKSATTKLIVTGSWPMAWVDKKMAITITPNETPATDLRANELPFIFINRSLIIPNNKAARIPTENTMVVVVFIWCSEKCFRSCRYVGSQALKK